MNKYRGCVAEIVTENQYFSALRNARLLALCCIIQLFNSSTVWAYDANSTVNFSVTGIIEEPSCEVSVKPSDNIDLGIVSYQHMTGKPGANSENVPVQLDFKNCSSGTASVTITFSGAYYDNTYTMIYKNAQTGSSGAKGVGLQLFSLKDTKSLGPGEKYTYAFSNETGGHTFDMIARMYTPYGKITPGDVMFITTFNVSYK
ncbi:fimbrial protein [Klebsiella spallanzanii]|uniref:fimbrial protein n=1 Tax=Klebsiella spallanzanii TaxID=2587528 RepID=UPI00115A7AE7|nr:fimbrial protein [Klebsiella spallanzanii]VUS22829.1 S-fimbrial protein subunit SfaG [Klebsiella spallanzanii]